MPLNKHKMAGLVNDYQPINIRVYGTLLKTHHVSPNSTELLMPVHKLCAKLLIDFFPDEIGPAAVQLFGLAMFNTSKKSCTWLNPKRTLEDIQNSGVKGLNDLYLRMRFVPSKSIFDAALFQNLCSRRSDDSYSVNYLIRYLYFQVKDDFVTDRLFEIYGEKVSSGKARGIGVLDLLIMARLSNIDPPEKIFDELESEKPCKSCFFGFVVSLSLGHYSLYQILPKRECDNAWKDYKLKNNMKTKLMAYSKEYSPDQVSLQDLMLRYIQEIMVDVTERYRAKYHDGKMVEITVNIPNGCGVYLREIDERSHPDVFSTIEELQSASIQPVVICGNDKTWNVLVMRANGIPGILSFDSQEVAESFVSGLDGYYRLIHNYYFSLCDQVEPPYVKHLCSTRCHGPIEDKFAVNKLKTSTLHDYYILKQDIYKMDKYVLFYSQQGQIMTKVVLKKDDKYCLEDDGTNVFSSLTDLCKSLSGNGKILQENAVIVRPKLECCEVLRNLFVAPSDQTNTDDEDSAAAARKRQPLVYQTTEVKVKKDKKLGNGYFTEVYHGQIRDKIVAVKQIRPHSAEMRSQEFRCYESLQTGVSQLLACDSLRFFVGILGICLTSPPQVIEEYAQFGSLTKFFSSGKAMTLQHFKCIAIQLAEALFYLDEKRMCHGNICCKNIMVFKHDDSDMFVKLADTGMLNIYNKLKIEHYLNVQRLPWIAPELFSNLSRTTIASDVYAFSTTLWECATFGGNPLSIEPLKDMSNDSSKIMDFYQKGNQINIPKQLQIQDHEQDERDENMKKIKRIKETVVDIMKHCWNNVEDRPESNTILKRLREAHDGYLYSGYNRYAEIVDLGSASFTPNDSSVSSLRPHVTCIDIPNILEPLECHEQGRTTPKHLAAENLKVDLPPLMNINCDRKLGPGIIRERPRIDKSKLVNFKFLIDSQRLRLNQGFIGHGHYGEVKLGDLYSSTSKKDKRKVAVKVLKEHQFRSVLESEEFFHEADLMARLQHDNIVLFIGVSDNMLVMEYVEKGCMRDYLKKKKNKEPLSEGKILCICRDIAAGMDYLAGERILHCDLAARNVLLKANLSAKISDFGLAKILDENKDYYKRSENKNLPAWWCSPEALSHRRFSTKADVWSYGIVMWEGFTHSDSPKVCKDVKNLLQTINRGTRLPKPDLCPQEVFDVMNLCWKHRPEERPSFEELEKTCRELCIKYPEDKDDSSEGNTESPPASQSDSSSQKKELSSADQSVKSFQTASSDQSDKAEIGNEEEKVKPETEGNDLEEDIKSTEKKTNNGCSSPKMSISQCNKISSPPPRRIPAQTGVFGSPLPPVPNTPDPRQIPLSYLLNKQQINYNDMDIIGAGNFGVVYKGTFSRNGKNEDVAIKTLKDCDKEKKIDEIESEVKILIDLCHENIVKFHGFCRTDALLVMELIENGETLLKYLQKYRSQKKQLENRQLITFCLGIAKGMEYLSRKKIIHCDLAARNVLLTKDLTTKISDFGLSKFLQEKAYYRRSSDKQMNIHWCAPEFLKTQKLSLNSDIWSFGIVIWEIFTYGQSPNICKTEMELREIAAFIIEKGCHLEKPELCPDHIYSLMTDCWKMEPEHRPKFPALAQKFQSYLVPAGASKN